MDKRFVQLTKDNVLKKIILCQCIHSPLCIIAFFISLGILNDSPNNEICRNIYEKGMLLYKAEWVIWPPALLFSFYFLPTQFRVLFDSLISLGFDIFNSYLIYNDTSEFKGKKVILVKNNRRFEHENK